MVNFSQDRLVVIDCETTGFGKTDRIVEIAAVTLDPATFQVIDEYETLVNPERDVGHVGIHGISSTMVEAAPVFQEIAVALGRRVHGAILVAHNLPFDQRMIAQEFERIGCTLNSGRGVCTLRQTSEKLNVACDTYGIQLTDHHCALADARATALLFKKITDQQDEVEWGSPVEISNIPGEFKPRTLHRPTRGDANQSSMSRIVSRAYYPYSDENRLQYLELLDWVLDDTVITSEEQQQLTDLAEELGLSENQRQRAHEHYVSAIVTAVKRDGVVTESEEALVERLASLLHVKSVAIPKMTPMLVSDTLKPGTSICFTGTSVINGVTVGRSELEEKAVLAGFRTVSSVSKKGCDVVVAMDVSSSSGKAKKARQYGIPIMSTQEFLDLISTD
jgi:DNA polymerase-3 subunit epsilon